MVLPDFRHFIGTNQVLVHSAKGSEWDKHKYVKKIDGVYYYPVGYEDGRTVDSLSDNKKEKKSDERKESKENQIKEVKEHFDQYLAKRGIDWRKLPKDEIDQMQRDIVKQLQSGKDVGTSEMTTDELAKYAKEGKLGEGDDRKKLLGERYDEVQKKINELMKGSTGQKDVSEATPESIKKAEEAAKKADSSNVHSGVDMDKVLSVNRNKKK